jgi:hypothetical protein
LKCDDQLLGDPTLCDDVDDAWSDVEDEPDDRTKVKKLVYFDGGWTFILDDELVMLVNDDVWAHFAQQWQTRIFGWICEGASGTYAISVFDNGRKVREALYANGELLKNEGSSLPEEDGVDWSSPFEDDVLKIADRMGTPFGCSDSVSNLHVYLLDESHMEN